VADRTNRPNETGCHETLEKILLVPDEFTATDGTLTPTRKLRLKAIEERYREQIDELYNEAQTSSSA
jgi:long-chain acyl-CoA synthetase